MLKRISSIKNVGTYKSCASKNVQLGKLTLIYGRNTYGKSTLGDIFSSLQSGNVESITARKSIPDDGSPQKIELSFSDAFGKKEVAAIFSNGTWSNKLPKHLRLAVYDDAFYHQNVFLGRTLTRATKEGFSDFILGAQGVAKAELIAAKSKKLKEKKSELRNIIQRDFPKISDLDKFLALPLVVDITTAKEELENKRSDYLLLKSQKQASKVIRERKTLFPLRIAEDFKDAVVAINNVLKKGLDNPHEAAKAELNRHIESHFVKPEGAEQWIKQGMSLLNGDNCHFCGQLISPQANELLDLYRQCFDDQFARHESYVRTTIERHHNSLNMYWIDKLNAAIESADLIVDNYPELAREIEFSDTIETIKNLHNSIKSEIEQLNIVGVELIEAFNPKISAKLADPKKEHEIVDSIVFSQRFNELASRIAHLNTFYLAFNKRANEFKAQYEVEQIEKNLTRLETEGRELAELVDRYDKNNVCNEVKSLLEELKALELEIPQLRESLSNEQGTFLKQYFSKINRHFKELGSRDFQLEYKSEPRGDKPLYSFKVKFKQAEIAENDLDKIFSESDRRSLGLSIFLASLDSIDAENLAKTIVVLDDPVTSFDENRITQTHGKLVVLADKCRQVIILSHFKDSVANFLKLHGFSNNDISLIEINRDDEGSFIENGNKDLFVKSAHHLNTHELIDFVERKIKTLSCAPRVYLEDVLSLRFSKQIREKDITNESLSKRIDALCEEKIVSKEIASQLHTWRKELNAEHHIWLDDDIENKRTTVARFLEFVFYELVPEPQGEA